MLQARGSGRLSTSIPMMVNWPLRKRKPARRVTLKLNRPLVQCFTEITSSQVVIVVFMATGVPDYIDVKGGGRI